MSDLISCENAKTIYVVTAGDYSDYHVIGVTANKEKAEHFCEWFNVWSYNKARIEVYEMDRLEPYGEGRYLYEVEQDKSGHMEVEQASRLPYDGQRVNEVWSWGSGYFVPVFADDEDHARKIAADLIAQYKWERSDEDE